jgi:hypothetical protein
MKVILTVIVLISLSLVPEFISWYQFLVNGGLNWPMSWSNEKVFWGLVFIAFSVAGICVAFRNKEKHPNLLAASLVLSALAIAPAIYNYAQHGLGPSSKTDNKDLSLYEFWVSDWWK